jgi:hypothetical protein
MTHVDLNEKTVAALAIVEALNPDLNTRDATVRYLLMDYAGRHKCPTISGLLEEIKAQK